MTKTDINIYTYGYCDRKDWSKLGFIEESIDFDNYIVLFLTYSNDQINVGSVINTIEVDKKPIEINIEIKNVNLGFGPAMDHIPKGFKSLILAKGNKKILLYLKDVLPLCTDWHNNPGFKMTINNLAQ